MLASGLGDMLCVVVVRVGKIAQSVPVAPAWARSLCCPTGVHICAHVCLILAHLLVAPFTSCHGLFI
jgi:hypothetical protein